MWIWRLIIIASLIKVLNGRFDIPVKILIIKNYLKFKLVVISHLLYEYNYWTPINKTFPIDSLFSFRKILFFEKNIF